MAIKIPILTSFDPKGLKQANAQFGKLQSSIGSLGRNFAAAGAVIAGAGALIGRAVADAAESQKVFAQTEAVLKSMGTTANGTAQDIANLASSLQKSTAFSDEAILAGQNLLLTFKNIQNQAGAGNDIFDQTSTLMLDVARAMGTSAAGEAIRLGKALNDPVKGISALTRVGIQFTDQQKAQIKALAESGDLMGAQKIILAELQAQFGGSAAAYAGTFAGQLEGLNNDLNDMSEEIGFMVMPAVQGMITEFRNLIPIIGPQLKAAIESVDWKALTQSVIGFTTFLIKNGQAIANTIITIFAINTAYKLMQVAIGITNTAIALNTWFVAKTAAGMTAATIAAGALRTAMLLLPWGIAIAGLGLVIAGITEADSAYRKTTPVVTSFGQTMLKSGQDAIWAAQKYGVAADAINGVKNAAAGKPKAGRTSVLDDYAYNLKTNTPIPKAVESSFAQIAMPSSGAGKAAKAAGKATGKTFADAMAASLAKQKAAVKEVVDGFIKDTPIGEEWEKYGSKLGNEIVKGVQSTVKKIGRTLSSDSSGVSDITKGLKVIYERAAALQERFVQRSKFQEELRGNILSAFDFTNLGKGIDSIMSKFRKQVEQTKQFRENLRVLGEQGLNQDLYRKLVENTDFASAAELVKGGAAAVSELNSLYGELQTFASDISTSAGNQLYNLGVDAGTGFIRTLENGLSSLSDFAKLKSQEASLQASIKALNNTLNMPTAQRGMAGRLSAEQKAEIIAKRTKLVDELQQLRKNPGFNTGNLRTGLDQYFLGGGQMTSGVSNQLAFLNMNANAQAASLQSAREARRNEVRYGSSININVNGGISTSAQIGQSVIDAIRAYERASGQVYARA